MSVTGHELACARAGCPVPKVRSSGVPCERCGEAERRPARRFCEACEDELLSGALLDYLGPRRVGFARVPRPPEMCEDMSVRTGDPSPWRENAVRALEDGSS